MWGRVYRKYCGYRRRTKVIQNKKLVCKGLGIALTILANASNVKASDPVLYRPTQYAQTVHNRSYDKDGKITYTGHHTHDATTTAKNGDPIQHVTMVDNAKPSQAYKIDENKASRQIQVPSESNRLGAILALPFQQTTTSVEASFPYTETIEIYDVKPWGDYIPVQLQVDQEAWTRGMDYNMTSCTRGGQKVDISDFPRQLTSLRIEEQVKVVDIIQDPLGQHGDILIFHIFKQNDNGIWVLNTIQHQDPKFGIRREIERLGKNDFETTEYVEESNNEEGEPTFTHPDKLVELFDFPKFN